MGHWPEQRDKKSLPYIAPSGGFCAPRVSLRAPLCGLRQPPRAGTKRGPIMLLRHALAHFI